MSERQTTGEFINYRIGERSGKTYNMIQEMAKEIDKLQKELKDSINARFELQRRIDKLQKENTEWFDIADNILRATNKYGEISIGEVAKYISKLQKENEELKEQKDNAIKLRNEIIEEEKELKEGITGIEISRDTLVEDIKELKQKLKSKEKQIKLMQKMNLPDEIEKNYISKDKIRTKIKELEEPDFSEYPIEKTIEVLKELLGDDE